MQKTEAFSYLKKLCAYVPIIPNELSLCLQEVEYSPQAFKLKIRGMQSTEIFGIICTLHIAPFQFEILSKQNE